MAKHSTVNGLVHKILCKSNGMSQKGRMVVNTLPSLLHLGPCVGITLKGPNGGTHGSKN